MAAPPSATRRQAALFAGLLLALFLASPRAAARTPQAPAARPPAEAGLADRSRHGGLDAGEAFRAATIAVSDGDSFVVRGADGARLRVRLAGIDAPEKSQPYSAVARRRLDALIGKREVVLAPIKIDPFGRLVAHVDVDGVDAALAMLEAGLAWHFARYDRDLSPELRLRYAGAAAIARRERLGLWRDDAPEPPWEFRRRNPR
ncbi:MAG: thermonuclease family protein [Limnobacter sp.]|nr:thermonuclease family protein [Limnobacter sp.]